MAGSIGKRDKWLLAIGVFKVVKAALLIALAIGVIKLLDGDVGHEIERWVRRLNLDARNPIVEKCVSKLTSLSPKKISLLSAGGFVYAGLFLTEGTGLLLRKRWGEYVTIIITGSFLPFEIYEMVAKEFNPFKLVLLLGNAAILIYLIWHLRHEKKKGDPIHSRATAR